AQFILSSLKARLVNLYRIAAYFQIQAKKQYNCRCIKHFFKLYPFCFMQLDKTKSMIHYYAVR
ncbi:MAG: hypothetical protein OXD32_06785, partial [Endozoicomonadaceae bacterium]|nr:hypothetical protein [Endozoicomonadaceae bacterium]